jgi:MinD-like ATPase involved in chromosome partitioning or flagellar assembly
MPYAARQTIVVQGLGGGVGTTRVSTEIAKRMAGLGRTLLLDWDARGAVGMWLNSVPPDDRCWEASELPDWRPTAPWAKRVWPYMPSLDVLTAQGRYPERAIEWRDAETEDLLRWAGRQYDYVVVDAGGLWSDLRHAVVTGLADVAVGVTGAFALHQTLALRWLEWTAANDWRVADRHWWIGTGYGGTLRGRRSWERMVGERWMLAIDWTATAQSDPWTPLVAGITLREAVMTQKGE